MLTAVKRMRFLPGVRVTSISTLDHMVQAVVSGNDMLFSARLLSMKAFHGEAASGNGIVRAGSSPLRPRRQALLSYYSISEIVSH